MKTSSRQGVACVTVLLTLYGGGCQPAGSAGTSGTGRVTKSSLPTTKASGSGTPVGVPSTSPGVALGASPKASGTPSGTGTSPSPSNSALSSQAPPTPTPTPIPIASGTPPAAPSATPTLPAGITDPDIGILAGKRDITAARDGASNVAEFGVIMGLCTDTTGRVFSLETNVVRRISADGNVKTLAGVYQSSGNADGVGTNARFNGPTGITCAPDGSMVYVADTNNHTIRTIALSGDTATVGTLAGKPGLAGADDGTGDAARFKSPVAVALSPDGSTLYVADKGNLKIRQINLGTGVVSTLAENYTDNEPKVTPFKAPVSILCSLDGTKVYVSDQDAHRIIQINTGSKAGTILAGRVAGDANGTGINASFYGPIGLTQDNAGTIYLADTSNFSIRAISPTGTVSTLKGLTGAPFLKALTFKAPKTLLYTDGNEGRIKTLSIP